MLHRDLFLIWRLRRHGSDLGLSLGEEEARIGIGPRIRTVETALSHRRNDGHAPNESIRIDAAEEPTGPIQAKHPPAGGTGGVESDLAKLRYR